MSVLAGGVWGGWSGGTGHSRAHVGGEVCGQLVPVGMV